MDNLAIARVLAEIGDLLEIKNENPFKIRAYRNASETIAHHPDRVASLTPADRLALPGIGRDLAAKIGNWGTRERRLPQIAARSFHRPSSIAAPSVSRPENARCCLTTSLKSSTTWRRPDSKACALLKLNGQKRTQICSRSSTARFGFGG